MLRWRNWRLKYVGGQDRALKLYPVLGLLIAGILVIFRAIWTLGSYAIFLGSHM